MGGGGLGEVIGMSMTWGADGGRGSRNARVYYRVGWILGGGLKPYK